MDGQIGLEKTPEEYVDKMVLVFRELRRILTKDGTCWLNLGDSYNSTDAGKNPGGFQGKQMRANKSMDNAYTRYGTTTKGKIIGLKPKDLCGIPWRVAFALQKDGWWLRQDIVWAKPNPMPESVTDRCTKAHEYIFLLTKSARYYYDHKAIMENAAYDGRQDTICKGSPKYANGYYMPDGNPNSVAARGHERWPNKDESGTRKVNKRDVWIINNNPSGYGVHFATFSEELITPCILAGCPKDGVVCDPFMGTGTTGVVAKKNGNSFVGIELNKKFHDISEKRIDSTEWGLPFED